jgi:hypothetical protein
MKAAFMLLVLLMVASTPGSTMAGGGRYQAIVVPPTNQTADRPIIIILDTEEGHLWEKSLGEKPFYAGQVNPPAEKGIWQSIGDFLVGKKAVTPKAKGKKADPLGIREKENEGKPRTAEEYLRKMEEPKAKEKPKPDYRYNPQMGKLEKLN